MAELRKTIQLDPRDWRKYFECLVIASIKTRDDRPNSWHTPLPPTNPAVRRQSRLVSRGQGQYDAFVVVLSPQTGKHSTFEVVNAAAATCNATAQASTSNPPANPGRAQPDDDKKQKAEADPFNDDPLADFDDPQAIRVRPGPVRTTLIRPPRLLDLEGAAYPGRQPDPGVWIQDFLAFFNLWPVLSLGTTDRYRFMRAQAPQPDLTMTQVVDKTIEQGALDGHTLDRQAVIGGIIARLPSVPGPTQSTSRVSFYLTFSIVRTGHFDVTTGRLAPPDAPGFQAAAQITWELHKENASGPEFTWAGQLTTFKDPAASGQADSGPFQLQSAYTGFQAAWVFSFLKGSLQVGPLAQALTGVARAQQAADGMIKLVPAGQVAAGGQILYTVPGFGGHLQIGGQAAVAFTAPAGAHSTIDFAPSIVMQWKLN